MIFAGLNGGLFMSTVLERVTVTMPTDMTAVKSIIAQGRQIFVARPN